MRHYYRRFHTIRDMVSFCEGYYPSIQKKVRRWNSDGHNAESIKRMLGEIINEIIRKRENVEFSREEVLKNVYEKI